MDEKDLLSSISKLLDRQNQALHARLEQVVEQLADLRTGQEKTADQIAALQAGQDNLEHQLAKLQINQEAVIMPRLDLLYEGHTGILETMQHDTRYQALQDRVETLESVVKYLSNELKHLKKAE